MFWLRGGASCQDFKVLDPVDWPKYNASDSMLESGDGVLWVILNFSFLLNVIDRVNTRELDFSFF